MIHEKRDYIKWKYSIIVRRNEHNIIIRRIELDKILLTQPYGVITGVFK